MEPHPLSGLEEQERKLLAIFKRFGGDGRAITVASLAVHAGTEARRLSVALRNLAARGFIQEAGRREFVRRLRVAGRVAIARARPARTWMTRCARVAYADGV